MTRKQKWHVLLVSCLLIAIVFTVNVYFLHIISHEPENPKKTTTQRPHFTTRDKHIDVKSHFNPVFINLKKQFISNNLYNISTLWNIARNWPLDDAIYSTTDKLIGSVVKGLRTAKIIRAENSQKGTQLKLLFTLEGDQNVFFKPQWYSRDHIIKGSVYSGKDRHNAEIVAFYLSALLDIRWVPLVVSRIVNIKRDIWDVASHQLKQTIIEKDNGTMCLYGKCFYCRKNETVCGDENGNLEGALILLIDHSFTKYRSPWQRTYNSHKQANWETNPDYCSIVKKTLPQLRILDLIDAAIFDFLLQNGDRHHYETLNDRIVLLDNGKGLGNPHKDFIDILAPLYQCCLLRRTTWDRLQLLSGGSLSAGLTTLLSHESAAPILTDLHLQAIDRRLLAVYSTVESCFQKFGKIILKNK